MNVLKEYKPLYKSDYFIADLYGGRAGARSYALTQLALYNLLYKEGSRGFFLRQTNATIFASLWTDFKDRIVEYQEMHGVDLSKTLEVSNNKHGENQAVNKVNGNTITTKGFQVSVGTQTANLKSLAGATDVYIDEFDEVSLEDFKKLKKSLRKKGADLKIIRAFNPPFAEHTIWEDYKLEKIGTDELIQITSKHSLKSIDEINKIINSNNKTYYKAVPKYSNHIAIHSTFINNYKNLNQVAISEYEKDLEKDPHDFCVNILGLISNVLGDVVYNDYSELNRSYEFIKQNDVLHVGMDFNVGKMNATIRIQRNGKERHVVDEFVNLYDTYQMCSEIRKKYPYHKIVVTSDASGKARSTSGTTDWSIIKSFKFTTNDLSSNPKVRDRINEVNTKFRIKEIFINKDNCPELHNSLINLKYKNGEPDKTKGYDHITEAFGYDIWESYNKKNNSISILV